MSSSIDALDPPDRATRSAFPLRLRLIGQMDARTTGDRSVLPLGRKTRALLAILALSAPRPMARSRLAELLWSRRLEEQARASLRQEIHRMLEALQPLGAEILRVTRDYVVLRAELVWLDVDEVLRATPEDPSSLSLLENELLCEFDGVDPALDRWLLFERGQLRDRVRRIAEALLDKQATPDAVLRAARQLVGVDRAHEGAWRAIMRAHTDLGERGLAIQAYDRCCAALADLIGARPSAETQRLIIEIRSGNASTTPDTRPGEPMETVRDRARSGATIGMLPLQLLGAGDKHADFSIGLTEEVTAALGRFRWLGLVATSSLAQAGTRDEAVLRRAFGLDFLLGGSVHQVDQRLRTALRLLDLRAGNKVVWARHFDCDTDDVLHAQDEIAAEVVAQIDPELLLIEGRRAADVEADDSTAYQLVVRALPMIMRLRKDEFAAAGLLLERALQLDPDYAGAHFWRAYWATLCLAQGWAQHPGELLAVAGKCADRAVTLDPQDARGLTIAGFVRSSLFGRPHEALELHTRALALNPNLAMAWGMAAMTHTYLGRLDEAGQYYARYRRLSPMDPNAFFFDAGMARLEISRRDYPAAVQLGRRSTELNPFYSPALQIYLSALGHAGLQANIPEIRARLFAIDPTATIRTARQRKSYQEREQDEHFTAGLRLAGLPEGD